MQSSPTPPSVPWEDVQLFLALCRSRTMAEAAERLGVDPSTVSRRLAGLEEALDAVLFDRGREGLRPTKAAEDLLPTAELAEDGVARFSRAADGLEREVSGLVRLTCPPDVEVLVLPALRELLAAHPRLRLSLEPAEQLRDLSRREADLALRTLRPRRGELVVRRLLTVRWRPAATPELARELAGVDDAAELPWIGWSEGPSGAHLRRSLERAAPGLEPALSSSRLAAQVAAARAGLGVALLPVPTLAHHGLVEVPAKLRDGAAAWPQDELFLVTHRALAKVPRVRATWEALAARLASLADEPATAQRGGTPGTDSGKE